MIDHYPGEEALQKTNTYERGAIACQQLLQDRHPCWGDIAFSPDDADDFWSGFKKEFDDKMAKLKVDK